MARHIRFFSNSQIYHIITKGIDNQLIFYDDFDREKFLNYLKSSKKDFNFKINAYCLMDNHIHLVLKIPDENLSYTIKNLLIRYVLYFNRRYNRIGPLFQDRFKSKNVESLNYFLEVCRYVHRNPEKAGIATTSEYKWSSYKEYMENGSLVDTSILMHYFNNNKDDFARFTNKVDNLNDMLNYAEYEIQTRLSDEEVTEIIIKQFNIINKEDIANYFKNLSKSEREKCVKTLLQIGGTSVAQLSRITKIYRAFFK